MILRCTAKLLKLFGVSPASLTDVARVGIEDEWYANLLWFNRRKCVLVTHAGTLFSTFVPDVRKADLTPVGPFVVGVIEESLAAEDLPADTFGRLMPDDVQLTKTASRVVLGCMNDLAKMIEYRLMDRPPQEWTDFGELNHWLRRTINGQNGYRYPIDLAGERALRLRGMSPN